MHNNKTKIYNIPAQTFMSTYLKMFQKLYKKIQLKKDLFPNYQWVGNKKKLSPLVMLRLDLIVNEFDEIKIAENDTVSGARGVSILGLTDIEQQEALRPYYQWYKSSGFNKILYCVEPESPYLEEAQYFASKLKQFFNDIDIKAHIVREGSLKGIDPTTTLIDRLFYPYELIEGGEEELKKFTVTISATFVESKLLFSLIHNPENPLNLTKKELAYFQSVYPYSIELSALMRRYGDTSKEDGEIEELRKRRAFLEERKAELEATIKTYKLTKKIESKLKTTKQLLAQITKDLKNLKEIVKFQKTIHEQRILFWQSLPEHDLKSAEGIIAHLDQHYPNTEFIKKILFSSTGYLIKNTDTYGENSWGARGVYALKEHSLGESMKQLEYKLHPSIRNFGNNPIIQKVHESKDFKTLWNGVIDGKYVRVPNDIFNYHTEDLKRTDQYVFARIAMFGGFNSQTGETFIPPMGGFTLVKGTVRAHGTPLSLSGPVRFT